MERWPRLGVAAVRQRGNEEDQVAEGLMGLTGHSANAVTGAATAIAARRTDSATSTTRQTFFLKPKTNKRFENNKIATQFFFFFFFFLRDYFFLNKNFNKK